MNLVIDCFKLVKGAGKSIGIYNLAKSVTLHLGERAESEADGTRVNSIIVLGNSYNKKDFDVPGVTFVELKGNPLNKIYCILWELFLVPWYAKRYGADRILFPRGFAPFGIAKRLASGAGKEIKDTIIIHDLIPFFYDKYYPGVFNKFENAYIMNRLKASIKQADRVITISEHSKEDILDKVKGCEKKITVIHNGLNDVFHNDTGNDSQGAEYIVAMTSGLPHKNAKGVLKAYEAYYSQTKEQGKVPLSLVVIGIADTSPYAEMDGEAKSHVRCYKFFENFEEMCRLATGGKAYLFLSYAEGFGFPPLEAMQMGIPVVCSDRSSLPEVVKDAGILVDPDDTAAVAKALIQVLTVGKLREELIAKGFENIKRFSWETRTDLYWKELFR
ncbi:MAG: glycosyltransferase family 4 protein [Clostridiales bacterium]|nr:glycosyltransferase family 4 protein [Clostridiales bacterium]